MPRTTEATMRYQLTTIISALLLLTACSRRHAHVPTVALESRLVSILVEVYDPVSNLAWENVSVRIVEADQEWSGCTCVSPFEDWFLTDASGRVLFDEYMLADAEVGFLEDGNGAAVLSSAYGEDEAVVVLEVDAVGFAPVIVEVPLRWEEPDVFVEIPFF